VAGGPRSQEGFYLVEGAPGPSRLGTGDAKDLNPESVRDAPGQSPEVAMSKVCGLMPTHIEGDGSDAASPRRLAFQRQVGGGAVQSAPFQDGVGPGAESLP